MLRPVVPLRRIAILCALMIMGLLRAERGVAEMQGRAGEPSRLLYVTNDRHGTWQFTVFGRQQTVHTGIVLVKSDRALLELPARLPLPHVDWEAFVRAAMDRLRNISI